MGRLEIDFERLRREAEQHKKTLAEGPRTLCENSQDDMPSQEKTDHEPNDEARSQSTAARKKIVRPKKTVESSSTGSTPFGTQNSRQPGERRKTFDQQNRRLTTYLRVETHNQLQALYNAGRIERISQFVDAAVREYIARQFRG